MAILRVYNSLTQQWESIPYIKGDKGDRGYGVSSVIYEYYLSTSPASPTGGDWGTIMPAIESGKYLWVRTKTTLENNQVITSDPALATLLNDISSEELNRRTAETNRNTAEGLRASAESDRVTAEGLRSSAESLRVTAEGNRVSAETTRGNNESQRVSAEAQRGYAETQRESAEAIRAANELLRIASYNHYPIVQNGTWWTWDLDSGEFVDSGEQAEGPQGIQGPTGNVYYAVFSVDPSTGVLTMEYDSAYTGANFYIDNNGHLEVQV